MSLNPYYSYKNAVNYMNQQWTKGWAAGTPDLEIPQICWYYLVV